MLNSFIQATPQESEPWVTLPAAQHFVGFDKQQEIACNQQRRQTLKFEFFKNTFDFLNDSEIRGDYFEFGTHRVRTFRMALSCARFYNLSGLSFHAFDSFEGLPSFGEALMDKWKPGALCTTLEEFLQTIRAHGLYTESVHCYKGFYDKTLTPDLSRQLSAQGTKAMMITVDCDYYQSATSVFGFIEPFLQHGTVVYLDDVFAGFKTDSQGGVMRAFQEFAAKSSFEFIPHLHVGWWGRSFIASARNATNHHRSIS